MSLLPDNNYHFITHWTVPNATLAEVYTVIADAEGLPRWWPAVYRSVSEVAPGDANGIGRTFDLYTKGWLPYTLRWQMDVREISFPTGLAIGATGDFNGGGIWTLCPNYGNGVSVTFDWALRADKPLLRLFSPVLKPAFAANHRWAMQIGEVSLRREVARRRREASVPAPPGPTTWEPWAAFALLLAILGGVGAAIIGFGRRRGGSGECPDRSSNRGQT